MAEKTLERSILRYAEGHLLRRKADPEGAAEDGEGAQSPELKAAFEKHKEETEGHVERLEQVFELIGKRAQGKTCEAIQGIIDEGEEIMEEFKGTKALDAGLISAAQAVEHYEITRYGTLKSWAAAARPPRRRQASRRDAEGRSHDRRGSHEARRKRRQPRGPEKGRLRPVTF